MEPATATTNAQPHPGRVLMAFAGDVALAGILTCVFALPMIVVGMASGIEPASAALWVTTMGMAAMGLATVALIRIRQGHQSVVRLAPRSRAMWVGAMIGVGGYLISEALYRLSVGSGIEAIAANAEYLDQMLVAQPAVALLLIVVVGPFIEELLFRQALFGRFLASGYPLLGAVVTSVLFAVIHEGIPDEGQALVAWSLLMLDYTLAGMLFAWVYWKTRRLSAAVMAHAVNNLIGCMPFLGA